MELQRGVTLIELVVVLVLVAVLCVLGFPAVRGFFLASSAAGTLTLLLREAQASARVSSAPVEVVVEADGRYAVRSLSGGARVARRTGSLGVPVSTNYPGGALVFSEVGLPMLPGTVLPRAGHFIVGRHTVTLQLGGCIRCR